MISQEIKVVELMPIITNRCQRNVGCSAAILQVIVHPFHYHAFQLRPWSTNGQWHLINCYQSTNVYIYCIYIYCIYIYVYIVYIYIYCIYYIYIYIVYMSQLWIINYCLVCPQKSHRPTASPGIQTSSKAASWLLSAWSAWVVERTGSATCNSGTLNIHKNWKTPVGGEPKPWHRMDKYDIGFF